MVEFEFCGFVFAVVSLTLSFGLAPGQIEEEYVSKKGKLDNENKDLEENLQEIKKNSDPWSKPPKTF